MTRVFRALLMAVLTGAAGAALALWGGDIATSAHGVSDFEGGRAMALVFLIMPAGFLAGAVIGLLAAWRMAGAGLAGFARGQAVALAATAVLALAVFGYSIWLAPKPPQIDGQHLNLEFEVRMPVGRGAPPGDTDFTVLFTTKGQGDDRHNADLRLDAVTESDGRVVIPASAFMYTTTRQRSLVVNDVGEDYFWFDLPLPASPSQADEAWTDWWPAPGKSATTDIRGNGGFQIRYRVARLPAE